MNKSEFFQALTLWFVVLIFLQTASGGTGGIKMVIGIFSIFLMWAIPLYLLREGLAVLLDK
jgi:hypothetical protein